MKNFQVLSLMVFSSLLSASAFANKLPALNCFPDDLDSKLKVVRVYGEVPSSGNPLPGIEIPENRPKAVWMEVAEGGVPDLGYTALVSKLELVGDGHFSVIYTFTFLDSTGRPGEQFLSLDPGKPVSPGGIIRGTYQDPSFSNRGIDVQCFKNRGDVPAPPAPGPGSSGHN